MSIRDALYSGASGLAGASAGISATSHNVANANTAGFSRRGVATETNRPSEGRLVVGRGVNVQGFTRASNERLVEQQIDAGGELAQSETRANTLRSLEAYFDPVQGTGPRTALSAFYDTLGAAARDPSEPGLRREVMASGQDLARVMNRTSSALTAAEAGQTRDIGSQVDDLNAILDEVAEVNRSIITAGGPLRSGDLLDRRDQLMRDASTLAGVELDIQPDGTAVGRLGGHVVVSGGDVRPVGVEADGSLSIPVGKGSISADGLVGGSIGGMVLAREDTRTIREDLDTIVQGVADALNTVHQGGFDAGGAAGGDLFTYDPSAPSGTIAFAVGDSSELAFAGAPTAFAGDSDNLVALLAVEDAPVTGGDSGGAALAGLGARLGSTIRSSDADARQAEAIRMDLDELHASLTGVDLDEEAANLLTYQAAYQASAKVIQTTDQLTSVLMDMVR